MAQQVNAEVFTGNFRALALEMRTQGLANKVRNYSGEGVKRFKDWLQDIEKAAVSVFNEEDRVKSIALQTLSGQASEFAMRYVREHPNCNWTTLRDALKERYGDLTDSQYATMKLQRIHQKEGESVQSFADRILSLADEAYTNAEMAQPVVQRQLKDCFVDGIRDDRIARKLIRERPNTLNAAVLLAIGEQRTSRTFGLRRRREEPMDIDTLDSESRQVSPRRTKSKDKKLDEIKLLASTLKEVLTLQKEQLEFNRSLTAPNPTCHQPNQPNYPTGYPSNPNKSQRKPKPSNLQWTANGDPICLQCKQAGHIKRNCPMRPTWTKGSGN